MATSPELLEELLDEEDEEAPAEDGSGPTLPESCNGDGLGVILTRRSVDKGTVVSFFIISFCSSVTSLSSVRQNPECLPPQYTAEAMPFADTEIPVAGTKYEPSRSVASIIAGEIPPL